MDTVKCGYLEKISTEKKYILKFLSVKLTNQRFVYHFTKQSKRWHIHTKIINHEKGY